MNEPHPDRRRFAKTLAGSALAGFAANALVPSPARAAEGAPLRLALVSAATYGRPGSERTRGSNHGTAFATIFNGYDEEKAAAMEGTFIKSQRRIEGARVVKVWDQDQGAAAALAAACGIETVAATPEECSEGVDAAILIDDGSGEQWRYAESPLRAGVPVFCDKPLAMNARDAAAMARLVRETGTPFLSASSLRFVPDITALRAEVEADEIGPVRLVTVSGPGDLVYYGIHALSMAYGVLGGGVRSVHNVGRPGAHLVRLRHGEDCDILLTVADRERLRTGFQIQLHGEKGTRSVQPDLKDLYVYLLEAFLQQLATGEEPVPVEEEAELIAALEAGERSLELGREVELEELV